MNGNTANEKIGGILAIRELISCTSAAAEAKVTKFAKALSAALNATTDFPLIELIADTFGLMARSSPISDVEYLEGELNRSLGWLKAKGAPYRRFAACTLLRQLAKNAPTIFFARVNEFFDLIWAPLWDPKEVIRVSAGQALSACLAVLQQRTYHLQWYCYLYDQFQEGFKIGTEEHVHGSLLVVNEALQHTGDFMIPRFKEVCRSIMALKDHKSRLVRAHIISLLPSLAHLCPDAFAREHMNETVEFLQKCAKTQDLRAQALLATGKLCIAVGPYLILRIDELMLILKDSFVGLPLSALTGGGSGGAPGSYSAALMGRATSAQGGGGGNAPTFGVAPTGVDTFGGSVGNNSGGSAGGAGGGTGAGGAKKKGIILSATVGSGGSGAASGPGGGGRGRGGRGRGRQQGGRAVDGACTREGLLCIADMVQGLGPPFHGKVLLLLEPMLQSGLTAELIDALAAISCHLPAQKPTVQYR